MKADLVESSGRFAALQDEWNGLLAASSSESPFLRWEWLYPWWTHLRGSRRLAIVTIRERDCLVALAPFCAARSRIPFFRRWEFIGTGSAGSDYLDVIVRQGYEAAAGRALAECVRRHTVTLRLDHLPVDSSLSKVSTPLANAGWTIRGTQHGVCPFIRLAGHTWDSFLATIGPAHRATTRRRFRLLDKKFRVRFDRVTAARDRSFALNRLFDFHESRFGRHGSAFHTPALRAFHLDATERLSRTQVLRLYTLTLDDEVAAVMYGMAFRGRFYFYQHGYDPRFQRHGVGRALLDMSIRAAIDEGLQEFDLLYGSEAYKSAWTSESRHLVRMDLFPAHLGGRLHRGAVETERELRALARRVISADVPQTR